jgi:hypothetical protein
MPNLDTDIRNQLAEEHVARLPADYGGAPSGSRMSPRLVFLTIALAFVAAVVVVAAKARVAPSARPAVTAASCMPAGAPDDRALARAVAKDLA